VCPGSRATLASRDAIFDDDVVGVLLDTFTIDDAPTASRPTASTPTDPDLTVDLLIDSKRTVDSPGVHSRACDSVSVVALSAWRIAAEPSASAPAQQPVCSRQGW
jgi:hypothetical protein